MHYTFYTQLTGEVWDNESYIYIYIYLFIYLYYYYLFIILLILSSKPYILR